MSDGINKAYEDAGVGPIGPVPEISNELKSALQHNTQSSARYIYLRIFRETTEQMYATTVKKNNDYGGADDPFKNFREFGELGLLVRMSDKFARIKTALVEKREFKVKDESLEDTLVDLANYSVLLLAYLRMNKK